MTGSGVLRLLDNGFSLVVMKNELSWTPIVYQEVIY
jgi:hypothetical protein